MSWGTLLHPPASALQKSLFAEENFVAEKWSNAQIRVCSGERAAVKYLPVPVFPPVRHTDLKLAAVKLIHSLWACTRCHCTIGSGLSEKEKLFPKTKRDQNSQLSRKKASTLLLSSSVFRQTQTSAN